MLLLLKKVNSSNYPFSLLSVAAEKEAAEKAAAEKFAAEEAIRVAEEAELMKSQVRDSVNTATQTAFLRSNKIRASLRNRLLLLKPDKKGRMPFLFNVISRSSSMKRERRLLRKKLRMCLLFSFGLTLVSEKAEVDRKREEKEAAELAKQPANMPAWKKKQEDEKRERDRKIAAEQDAKKFKDLEIKRKMAIKKEAQLAEADVVIARELIEKVNLVPLLASFLLWPSQEIICLFLLG